MCNITSEDQKTMKNLIKLVVNWIQTHWHICPTDHREYTKVTHLDNHETSNTCIPASLSFEDLIAGPMIATHSRLRISMLQDVRDPNTVVESCSLGDFSVPKIFEILNCV